MKNLKLNDLFNYCDGELYWKISPARNVFIGDKAGYYSKNSSYGLIRYKGKSYTTHILIFFLFNGYRPPQVDHIDGNPRNNRIENLRAATRSQNQYNAKLSARSSSGVKNVCWRKADNKWEVRISQQLKRIHIGVFDDLELAELVAIEARDKYHKRFARHK